MPSATFAKDTTDLDVLTLEPLSLLDSDEKIVLHDGTRLEVVSKEYLLGWVSAEFKKGKLVTEIAVKTISVDGAEREFLLSEKFWQHTLLKEPYKEEFGVFWDRQIASSAAKAHVLDELRKIPGFKDRLKLFIHDLRKFGDNADAQSRLTSTGNEFFLGLPYFDDTTRDKLLSLPVSGQNTLLEHLQVFKAKKAEDSEAEICASHDLAPLFETVFEVKWAQINSELKASKKALKKLERSLLKK